VCAQTQHLGIIQLQNAWVHNFSKGECKQPHAFGVSNSNKEKMVRTWHIDARSPLPPTCSLAEADTPCLAVVVSLKSSAFTFTLIFSV
jgi:hypothetical protein